jgi:hypothetical protein
LISDKVIACAGIWFVFTMASMLIGAQFSITITPETSYYLVIPDIYKIIPAVLTIIVCFNIFKKR